MEDLALWGNAAAVPVIIAITQLLKKNFPFRFKRRADVISLAVSLLVCSTWWLYNTPEYEIFQIVQGGPLRIFKGLVDLVIVSFATWLSATKSYDLFLGEKKRAQELSRLESEREELRSQLKAVQNGESRTSAAGQEMDPDQILAEKLRAILEEQD